MPSLPVLGNRALLGNRAGCVMGDHAGRFPAAGKRLSVTRQCQLVGLSRSTVYPGGPGRGREAARDGLAVEAAEHWRVSVAAVVRANRPHCPRGAVLARPAPHAGSPAREGGPPPVSDKETRRGGLTTNGIHLNLSPRSSSPTGPPQFTLEATHRLFLFPHPLMVPPSDLRPYYGQVVRVDFSMRHQFPFEWILGEAISGSR